MAFQFSGQIETSFDAAASLRFGYGYQIQLSAATEFIVQLVNANAITTILPTLSFVVDTNVQNGMTSAGADDGALINTHTSTLLYVYTANYGAFTSANGFGIGVSTTAPTGSTNLGYFVLDPSGAPQNGLDNVFIGCIYLDGSGNLNDTVAFRGIANFYNRRQRRISLTPAYNNNNAATTFALTAASWARLNGGTGDTVQYIDLGTVLGVYQPQLNVLDATARFVLGGAAPASVVQVGIGDNSNTNPAVAVSFAASAASGTSVACRYVRQPAGSAALVTLTMLGMTNGSATTFQADQARNGASADPTMTGLEGYVWC